MALKASYPTAEEIPQELKAHYKQDGANGFVLDAEGMEPATKVEEFRRTNIELQKERDQKLSPALKAFTDIGTVEDFQHLKSISDQLDEGKLIRSGKLEEAVEKRMEKATKEWEAKEKKLTDSNTQLNERLSQKMINEAVTTQFLELGGKKSAVDDIVRRARDIIKVEDGKLVFYDKSGERDYTRTGDDAVVNWLKELSPNATHLFEENHGASGGSGGGAQHERNRAAAGAGAGRYEGPNPWKPDMKNSLDLRMKISKENPALAKKLRAEAGLREVPA